MDEETKSNIERIDKIIVQLEKRLEDGCPNCKKLKAEMARRKKIYLEGLDKLKASLDQMEEYLCKQSKIFGLENLKDANKNG